MRCLGEVVDGQVFHSRIGAVVAEEWLKIPTHYPRVHLDEWIVMPDHVHGILIFQGQSTTETKQGSKHLRPGSLGAAIGTFKSDATKRIWRNLKNLDFAWQPRFHDVIVHTPEDLERVRAYIRENPKRWKP